MSKKDMHHEAHRLDRVGWLRAAVLGANDGIVSTASLILGVVAANASRENILLSGVAGLAAGALSMAAGEYVSVSSQADTEHADLKREEYEIEHNTEFEKEELAQIYVERGLQPALAKEVAEQLMEFDAIGSHARDELGIMDSTKSRPLQAALASAMAFSVGAFLPLMVAIFSPPSHTLYFTAAGSVLSLFLLGYLSARLSGANVLKASLRIVFWGALAMIVTSLVGKLFGFSGV